MYVSYLFDQINHSPNAKRIIHIGQTIFIANLSFVKYG